MDNYDDQTDQIKSGFQKGQPQDDFSKSRMKQGLIACKLYDFPAFDWISRLIKNFV